MASIFIVAGKERGKYYVLENGVASCGRDEGADLQVVDEMVSRRHLEFHYVSEDKDCKVKDLESANGVFVNGGRISGEKSLADGDTIKIGESMLLYSEKNIRDLDTAMAFIKKRGEHGKSTLIR